MKATQPAALGGGRNNRDAELERFFAEAQSALLVQAEQDKTSAPHFNVFQFIEPDEDRLSDVLAFLLDPRSAHGQGDMFLRLLMAQLGFNLPPEATRQASVTREALTYMINARFRRMDVLVDAGVLLIIENKVRPFEQPLQVKDYLQHLKICCQRMKKKGLLVYLTPAGEPPDSLDPDEFRMETSAGWLRAWGYDREIQKWLDECLAECKAPRIKAFLSDFINYVHAGFGSRSEQSPHNP